jgi:hypothetical protein
VVHGLAQFPRYLPCMNVLESRNRHWLLRTSNVSTKLIPRPQFDLNLERRTSNRERLY